MKKLRKLTSLLLAAVLMLSMSTVVFANTQTVTVGNGSGSITVSNATEDETYAIYKIFDLTYNKSTESYSYTITSDWVDFFTGSGDGASYVDVTEVDGVYYVTWKSGVSTTTTSAQELGQKAAAYAKDKNLTATASTTAESDTITFKGLDLGYYLVTSSVGSLVELDTVNTSATVVDKNAKPTIDKYVSDTETDTGTEYSDTSTTDFTDTVYYKITITGIDEITSLTLHDLLPTGFSLKEVTAVYLYSFENDTDYKTLTTSEYSVSSTSSCNNCTFEITFDNLLAETNTDSNYYTKVTSITNPENAYIVVYYTVTVSSTASTGTASTDANTNTAWLTYSGDNTSATVTTDTYIYDFYVYKYTTVDSTETALSGAKFILYYTEDNNTYYAQFNTSGNLTGWTETKANATALESDSKGLIHFNGLDAGIYTLEETVAPDGYALLSNTISVTISSDGSITSPTTYSVSDGNSGTVTAIKVENSTNSAMPTTGGIGTTIFYIIGCILVLGAAILLVTRVRMSKTAK